MDAAEAVEVAYEELPFVLHSEDAMRPGAAVLWDEVPDNVLVDTAFGDVAATDRAFASAAHVVAREFHVGRVTGVPMEPRAALGELRRRDRALHALCRLRRRGAAEERALPPCSAFRPIACGWCRPMSAAISAPAIASSSNSVWRYGRRRKSAGR